MNLKEKREQLDRLLSGKRQLLELTMRLNRFNPFKILKIDKYEIRHSNMLAWLLDPEESHGLGDKFLRHFISSCLQVNQDYNGINVPLNATTAQLAPLADVRVHRESNHIDLTIVIPTVRWIIVIENKIHSDEGDGQLDKYYSKIRSRYLLQNENYNQKELERLKKYPANTGLNQIERPNEQQNEDAWLFLGIFLTLDGHSSKESDKYIAFSYEDLAIDLAQILKMAQHVSIPVRSLIENYLDTLQELTLNEKDKEIELAKQINGEFSNILNIIKKSSKEEKITNSFNLDCAKVLQKHARAIEMAIAVGKRENNELVQRLFINDPLKMVNLHSTPHSTTFAPREWIKYAKENKFQCGWKYSVKDNNKIEMPIVIWFWHPPSAHQIAVLIEVGPVNPPEARIEFIHKFEMLKLEGKLRNYNFTEESKYTRIYSKYLKIAGRKKEDIFRELWYGQGKQNGADVVVDHITQILTSQTVDL